MSQEPENSKPGPPSRSGLLVVVSGPSGSGKTTLCRRMAEDRECVYSLSCTTRPPREGEVDGVDYQFLDTEEFVDRATRGEFLEHAVVHGNHYGSLRSAVLDHLAAGTDVIMDIDVQGAALVRACEDPEIHQALVDVFILPPDMKELLHRLQGRGTESDAEVALRMRNALDEISHWSEYTFTILSGTQKDDRGQLRAILRSERQRTLRIRPKIVDEVTGGTSADPGTIADQPELFGE